jgi:hypothetical protein
MVAAAPLYDPTSESTPLRIVTDALGSIARDAERVGLPGAASRIRRWALGIEASHRSADHAAYMVGTILRGVQAVRDPAHELTQDEEGMCRVLYARVGDAVRAFAAAESYVIDVPANDTVRP